MRSDIIEVCVKETAQIKEVRANLSLIKTRAKIHHDIRGASESVSETVGTGDCEETDDYISKHTTQRGSM